LCDIFVNIKLLNTCHYNQQFLILHDINWNTNQSSIDLNYNLQLTYSYNENNNLGRQAIMNCPISDVTLHFMRLCCGWSIPLHKHTRYCTHTKDTFASIFTSFNSMVPNKLTNHYFFIEKQVFSGISFNTVTTHDLTAM